MVTAMSKPSQGSTEGANAPTRAADAPRRGRPPGSEETPENLIRRELIAHLKLYKQLREIVSKRVATQGDTMEPEDLSKFMDLLRKGVVEMARPIVAPAKSDSARVAEEEDPQKILSDLLSTTKG